MFPHFQTGGGPIALVILELVPLIVLASAPTWSAGNHQAYRQSHFELWSPQQQEVANPTATTPTAKV
jgi:hypothetical protein